MPKRLLSMLLLLAMVLSLLPVTAFAGESDSADSAVAQVTGPEAEGAPKLVVPATAGSLFLRGSYEAGHPHKPEMGG